MDALPRPVVGYALMDENWRPVIGYEGWYEVSDLGRIKRVRPEDSTYVGRIIKHVDRGDGRMRVSLSREGQIKIKYIHRLVASAFIGEIPSDREINHIDGDPGNNVLSNLEIVTKAENGRHKAKLGLAAFGERHGGHLLTEVQVRAIRELKGVRLPDLASVYDVHWTTIYAIQTGRIWGYLDGRTT